MVEEEADIEETEATWEDDTQTATNVSRCTWFYFSNDRFDKSLQGKYVKKISCITLKVVNIGD